MVEKFPLPCSQVNQISCNTEKDEIIIIAKNGFRIVATKDQFTDLVGYILAVREDALKEQEAKKNKNVINQ